MTTQNLEMRYVLNFGSAKKDLAELAVAEARVGTAAAGAAVGVAAMEKAVPRAAAGTRNLGQAALEGSRALEDLQYGIGGVVNNIPSLVQSLGAGSGVAAAFSVAAVAGVKLYGVWQESKANANVFKDAIESIGPSMSRLIDGSIQPMRDGVAGLLQDLRNFGKDARQIVIDDGVQRLAELEAGQERLQRNIYKARQRVDAIALRGEAGDLETARAVVAQLERRLAELPGQIGEVRNLIDTSTRAALTLDANEDAQSKSGRAKSAGEDFAKKRADMEKQAVIDAFRLRVEREKAERARLLDEGKERYALAVDALTTRFAAEEDLAKDHARAQARIDKDLARERERIAKESADARLAAEKRAGETLVAVGENTFSGLLSAGQDYLAMKIAGEKNAELIATANFLKSQGQQLVSLGTRAVVEGLLISANPATPGLGVPLTALGGVAIGVGVGMGAGGAAISANLPGAGGGGAPRDLNPPPRRAGSGGITGSGSAPQPTNITIVYGGPTGPVAEQVARSTRDALRNNERRGRR